MQAVRRWQADRYYPPLTCQSDPRHGKLMPVEVDGHVALQCALCPYVEHTIPDVVLEHELR